MYCPQAPACDVIVTPRAFPTSGLLGRFNVIIHIHIRSLSWKCIIDGTSIKHVIYSALVKEC